MSEEFLEPILTRLAEVRHFIQEAEKNYFVPDLFRINLNAAIQSSRNVTFVVQAQKSEIAGFDSWYNEWQSKMRAQPLLKWLVDARNHIVKQGDLKVNSILRVGLVLSYYDIPQQEFEVPIRFDVGQILKRVKLPSLPRDVAENAYLRIERRWVVNDLPDREILDVLRYGLAVLEALVEDLRRHVLEPGSPTKYSPDPPSKDSVFDPRILLIRLKDGSLAVDMASKTIPIDPDDRERVMERYGVPPLPISATKGKASLRETAEYFMDYATRVLRKDGYHMSLAILIPDSGPGKLIGIEARDNAEKYLIWRKLADDVRRVGATRVIAVSETWVAAFDKDAPYRRPVDAPKKEEALHVIAASKDGTVISLVKKFKRNESGFTFEDTEVTEDARVYLLEPVREVWGLPRFEVLEK